MPHRYLHECPICLRKNVLNLICHLRKIHHVTVQDWLEKVKWTRMIIVNETVEHCAG